MTVESRHKGATIAVGHVSLVPALSQPDSFLKS
jgi:hypothetical protein